MTEIMKNPLVRKLPDGRIELSEGDVVTTLTHEETEAWWTEIEAEAIAVASRRFRRSRRRCSGA